jgi:hypothetical protein
MPAILSDSNTSVLSQSVQGKIYEIRQWYAKKLHSKNEVDRQMAAAVFLIVRYALRVVSPLPTSNTVHARIDWLCELAARKTRMKKPIQLGAAR